MTEGLVGNATVLVIASFDVFWVQSTLAAIVNNWLEARNEPGGHA